MSFSPDIFRKKLDLLQETQDSIVSISQWVLFHHRHANDLCHLWSDYTMAKSPQVNLKKRLSLLYLCNDVVQQARHKRKPEFAAGFAEILPKVLNHIYSTVDGSIKPKIDRLIGVWEERGIFGATQIRDMRRGIELLKTGKSMEDAGPEPEPTTVPDASGPKVAADLVPLNNLYSQMSQLLEVCLSNLTQIGFQSKTYLPHDTSVVDNLPLPKVYISKLNVLEKLCSITTKNLLDIKTSRLEVLSMLNNLQILLNDGLTTDESKVKLIAERMERLHATRSELQGMLDDESTEPSPTFDSMDDSGLVPTYEDSDSDDEEEERPVKKLKTSDSSDTTTARKSVAFSEDIQIKEYERDEQTEKGGNAEDDYNQNFEPELPADLKEYESHHKDDLELLHERSHSSDTDGYEPSAGEEDEKSGLLSLLSKLS